MNDPTAQELMQTADKLYHAGNKKAASEHYRRASNLLGEAVYVPLIAGAKLADVDADKYWFVLHDCPSLVGGSTIECVPCKMDARYSEFHANKRPVLLRRDSVCIL